MFEVQGLYYRWPASSRATLDGLQMRVAPGEIVGISGDSGVGKSTLAKLLAGHLPARGGVLRLDGRPLPKGGVSPVQLVAQHAELALNPRMRIGASLHEGWQPPPTLCQRFGIRDDWLGRYPHELSGGELQRIAVVRALVPGLRVLIADEMTTMHDPITQVQLWKALLETLRPLDVAIIAVSHDQALLQALSARCLRLTDGLLIS